MRLECFDENLYLESFLSLYSWILFCKKELQDCVIAKISHDTKKDFTFHNAIPKKYEFLEIFYNNHAQYNFYTDFYTLPCFDITEFDRFSKQHLFAMLHKDFSNLKPSQLYFSKQTTKALYNDFLVYISFLSNIMIQKYTTQRYKKSMLFCELIFINQHEMRKINKHAMQKDYATDVLSFPLEILEFSQEQCLGSILINFDDVLAKARFYNHNIYAEISLLFIHGFLHLLGFNHENDNGEHRKNEEEIVGFLHLPQSLIVRNTL